MQSVMHQVMSGALTPAQISALLIALRIKGESVDEIAAAASVMRELSTKVNVEESRHLIDTCARGGANPRKPIVVRIVVCNSTT